MQALPVKVSATFLLCFLAGCATVSARGDYRRTRQLVAERTGATDLYVPGADAVADERVRSLLEGGLTMEEAIQVALLNNREFQERMAEIGVSRAALVQSTLFPNPTLALGLQFPEGGGLTDLTLDVSQQIADFWQIPLRKTVAAAELEQAILGASQRAVELIAEVRSRFYRVLALQQALSLLEEDARLAERSVALTEEQLHAGEVSEFDVNLARTGAADVQEELITLHGQLAQAQTDLVESLSLATTMRSVDVVGKLPDPTASLPPHDALLSRALDERFDLRLALLDVERAEAALRLEYRRVLPDVQVGLGFERNEQRALPGRRLLADTARASLAAGQLTAPDIQSRGQRRIEHSQIIDAKLGPSLAVTLPIFDQNQAQIAEAQARALQARKRFEARAESVAAEVDRAAAAAESAAELLKFQTSTALPLAHSAVAGAAELYRAGEQGIVALLQAQEALVKRSRSHVSALRNYAVAIAQLESAIGGGAVGAIQRGPSLPPTSEPVASPVVDLEAVAPGGGDPTVITPGKDSP